MNSPKTAQRPRRRRRSRRRSAKDEEVLDKWEFSAGARRRSFWSLLISFEARKPSDNMLLSMHGATSTPKTT